jgi:hypothetical protein
VEGELHQSFSHAPWEQPRHASALRANMQGSATRSQHRLDLMHGDSDELQSSVPACRARPAVRPVHWWLYTCRQDARTQWRQLQLRCSTPAPLRARASSSSMTTCGCAACAAPRTRSRALVRGRTSADTSGSIAHVQLCSSGRIIADCVSTLWTCHLQLRKSSSIIEAAVSSTTPQKKTSAAACSGRGVRSGLSRHASSHLLGAQHGA